MRCTNFSPGKWSTACAVIVSATALLSSAPASADPIDDAFVGALTNYGITVSDPDSAIATAHNMCAALDNNQSSSVLAMRLMRDTNLSAKQAGYFIGVSVAAYCPEHKGETDPSVTWLLPPFPMTQ
jgi:Protein of unknown function (DUF732)